MFRDACLELVAMIRRELDGVPTNKRLLVPQQADGLYSTRLSARAVARHAGLLPHATASQACEVPIARRCPAGGVHVSGPTRTTHFITLK